MEQARLETNPPKDRFNIVYLILLLHGIGTLLPWNMFITAKSYFVDYKLSVNYTGVESDYAGDFMPYLGFAAQGPGLVFNWLNIFVQIGGKLTTRIVWSIVVEMVAFIITVTLAMTDTSDWPGVFFWLTMLIVVILNMANGIYQNTVYGMAAKLPPKYTGVIIIGANISGTLSAIISIISLAMAPNPRTAAIYYFITALFVLSTCFDTYFALPLNRFYKYHELMSQKDVQKKRVENIPNGSGTGTARIPYWSILRQCGPQCFNVFLVFCVTLSLFPSVHSDIKRSDRNFMIGKKYYVEVMCFLTFNLCSMIGSSFSTIGSWPGPKMLWVPVVMRIAFVPLFLMCNYHPITTVRTMPVIIDNDWLYWIIGITMGLTNGYFSSVAMMYCSR
ncbi:hypothetical protein AAG570_009291 [Ranatra chinensis]|uniref:Equilibrative nucleoside transporter n=1 Tax=Ranatra chinensis TaxID=642074 RepID=A0ABD0YZK1_9HEMI